ncbi:hypothetical protein HYC85_025240 [Camellia sinensis]|uniref:cellulase n=1 Tax=Camellia sinensis TaxID=4442 RepID=A0A7J7GE93_CAMSI|nr:hypothetical protein HYC85_025240 [Camellia sinensis]
MHGLPGNLEFPNLHLLKLDCNAGLPPISLHDLNKGMEEIKVQETQDSFYQGMKELKVLALSDMYGSLTTSLRCLTNLRTLSLFRCRLIDDSISVIGALENLEILSFADSYINELPKEIIGHLAHLKVLDLLGCVVERIYPGVLSSLSKLEELYVGYSFQSWCGDEERKESAKATIDELASLYNLVALDIDLINMSFWPRGLVVEKLKKFDISVGSRFHYYILFGCSSLSNQLNLGVENMSDIIRSGYLQRPEDMTTSRQVYKIDPNNPGSDLAGETTTAMAAASVVFRHHNPSYANELLTHAAPRPISFSIPPPCTASPKGTTGNRTQVVLGIVFVKSETVVVTVE